ncbi:MAG: hypothetical protein ACON39_07445 [Coraliomargaritaceae bacterium]
MISVNLFMENEYKNPNEFTEGIHFEPEVLRMMLEKAEKQGQTLSCYINDLIVRDITCQHSSTMSRVGGCTDGCSDGSPNRDDSEAKEENNGLEASGD